VGPDHHGARMRGRSRQATHAWAWGAARMRGAGSSWEATGGWRACGHGAPDLAGRPPADVTVGECGWGRGEWNGIAERTYRGARTQGTCCLGHSTEEDTTEEGGSDDDDCRRPRRSEVGVAIT
jgi:hypothetical protein